MKRKQILIMLAVMTVFLISLLYFFGWFAPDRGEAMTLAKSDNWQLLLREEAHNDPYLIYTGNGKIEENIQIQGGQFYNTSEASTDKESLETINKELRMEHYVIRGLPLGENRWYINENNSEQRLQAICIKLMWTANSENFSEYIVSENISEGQIAKANELMQ